jgi:uncharacterized protein (UPF0261 family)
MNKRIILLATLDTKGEEADFLKNQIEDLGDKTIIIDSGVVGKPTIKTDITREEVAAKGGIPLSDLLKNPTRERAAPVMAGGAIKIVKELISNNKAHGIISMGGTQGTSLATEVMRTLPYGFPKVMVSTMASSDVSVFIDIKDIVMIPSVSDILGLNPVLKKILANAAAAVSGMANTKIGINIGEKLLIGICNVGITTPGAVKAIELLKKRGYDTIVFHGVGSGGRAMEQMMRDGIIGAVFDYALVEVSNNIYKGLNNGGPDRLTAAGKLGIPQVICPGGIEVLAFWVKEGDALPERWKGRKEIRHSSLITTVRCNKEEMLEAAKEVVKRLKYTRNRAVFMIPKGAYSLYSKKGMAFFDPDANSVFADYIKENLPDNFQIIEIDSDLTDPEFVKEGINQLIKLIESRQNQ